MIDLLVVGAGPCGIAAACAAKREGLRAALIDRGSLLASIRRYPDALRFFSTPELLEIDGVPFACADEKPRRDEALRYWASVARDRALDVRPFAEVLGIEGARGDFLVRARRRGGEALDLSARHVVLATGAFEATPLGIPGESLPHVDRFFQSPLDYVGERTVVLGGRNSACEAALALARAGVDVTIAYRGAAFDPKHVKPWVLPDLLNRIGEKRIRACLDASPLEIDAHSVRLRRASGAVDVLEADRVLALTGYGPDPELLRRCGVALGRDGAPVHDPKTFETTRAGVFVAGVVCGGAVSGRVFVENGRFHGKVVVESILRRQDPRPA